MTMTNEQLGARVDRVEGRIASLETKLDTIMERTARFDEISDAINTISKVAGALHRIAKWFAPIIAVGAAFATLWATMKGVK